jgi:hypothetical protein
MGYDFRELLAEPSFVPTSLRWLGLDMRNIGYGLARNPYRAWIFKDKDYIFPEWVRYRLRGSVIPSWLKTYARKDTPSKAP